MYFKRNSWLIETGWRSTSSSTGQCPRSWWLQRRNGAASGRPSARWAIGNTVLPSLWY